MNDPEIALTRESRKLIGKVRTVELEFAELEETDGETVEVRNQPAGFQSFNIDGSLLEEISPYRLMMEDSYKDKYLYNEDGRLIERYEFDVNEKLFGKSTFEYTDDNKLVEYHFYFANEGVRGLTSQLKLGSRTTYSKDGWFLQKDYYDEKGNLIPKREYPVRKVSSRWIDSNTYEEQKYDEQGRQADNLVTKFDANGNQIEFSVFEPVRGLVIRDTYEYEFDEFGNWTVSLHKHWVVGWGEFRMHPFTITRRRIEYFE